MTVLSLRNELVGSSTVDPGMAAILLVNDTK